MDNTSPACQRDNLRRTRRSVSLAFLCPPRGGAARSNFEVRNMVSNVSSVTNARRVSRKTSAHSSKNRGHEPTVSHAALQISSPVGNAASVVDGEHADELLLVLWRSRFTGLGASVEFRMP